MSVKLQPAPKCETPAPFRGALLKKLKIGLDLHCDTPLQQPLLELKPDQDQVICYFCVLFTLDGSDLSTFSIQ